MRNLNPPGSRPGPQYDKFQELFQTTTLTYRKLDYWCRQGLIPGHDSGESVGSGNRRVFTDKQVDFIRLMNRLVDAGMNPADASDAVMRGMYMGSAFITFPGRGIVMYIQELR